jgi:hypothetical protein
MNPCQMLLCWHSSGSKDNSLEFTQRIVSLFVRLLTERSHSKSELASVVHCYQVMRFQKGSFDGRIADFTQGHNAGTMEALVSAGWTVHGTDPRGHARTAPSGARLGDFAEGGFHLLGWRAVLLEEQEVS